MPNLSIFPLQGTLVDNNTTASTTNGTSAALTLPLCESYRFLLEVNTVSGTTSPTLQVAIATSADGGTVYQDVLQFTQATTTGQGRQMLVRPYLGYGDVATELASSVLGTADMASGIVANNGPIDPAHIKVRWVIGGSGTPSFNWRLKWIGVPQDLSS